MICVKVYTSQYDLDKDGYEDNFGFLGHWKVSLDVGT